MNTKSCAANCGNGQIDINETCTTCPVDVVCPAGQSCTNGVCRVQSFCYYIDANGNNMPAGIDYWSQDFPRTSYLGVRTEAGTFNVGCRDYTRTEFGCSNSIKYESSYFCSLGCNSATKACCQKDPNVPVALTCEADVMGKIFFVNTTTLLDPANCGINGINITKTDCSRNNRGNDKYTCVTVPADAYAGQNKWDWKAWKTGCQPCGEPICINAEGKKTVAQWGTCAGLGAGWSETGEVVSGEGCPVQPFCYYVDANGNNMPAGTNYWSQNFPRTSYLGVRTETGTFNVECKNDRRTYFYCNLNNNYGVSGLNAVKSESSDFCDMGCNSATKACCQPDESVPATLTCEADARGKIFFVNITTLLDPANCGINGINITKTDCSSNNYGNTKYTCVTAPANAYAGQNEWGWKAWKTGCQPCGKPICINAEGKKTVAQWGTCAGLGAGWSETGEVVSGEGC